MNGRILLLLPVLLIGLLALLPEASAAADLSVNMSLPSGSLLQGQVMAADLAVSNNENYPVRIYKIGVHYDWMPADSTYALDFGNNYVQVESNMRSKPGQFLVSCDKNTSVGYHKYYFKLNVTSYDTASQSWVSSTITTPEGYVYVDSPFRQQSLTMLQEANQSLNNARAANYSSKAAKACLFNATNNMIDGWSAYNSNDFEKAINNTYDVTLLISQARTAENEYLAKKSNVLENINAVNVKIATLAGSDSPDTRRLVNESLAHLQQANIYLAAEEFEKAKVETTAAETSVNNAVNAQYTYQVETNQTDESRGIAERAIRSAEATIAQSDGLTSAPAGNLLREAAVKLDSAREDFNASAYLNASNKASVAQALASQALKADADYHQQQAREKISTVGELSSPQARDELNESRLHYNQSLSDYARDDFRNAIIQADVAYVLANNSTVTEAAWKKTHGLNSSIPGFGAVPALLALLVALFAMIAFRRR